MLKVPWILVRTLALVGCAVALCACGQKGTLKMPNTPASQGRATLPQSLNPWHVPPARAQRPAPGVDAPSNTPAEPPPRTETDNDATPSSSYLTP
ncbi:MAG: hypothetical protein CFE41_02625 [Burkholderiales bacterium PBB2]|nr:MAG: hypothetical protein CFE41_02625 [Burkholderiales bacterium PBB2]